MTKLNTNNDNNCLEVHFFQKKLGENVGQAERKTSCDYYLVFRKLYNLL